MPEEKEGTPSNIDSIWLKCIFEDIRILEGHITLSKAGFKDVEEMISLGIGDLVEVQLRNLKLTTIKFLNILDNVQTKIKNKFFEKTKKMLKAIEETILLEEIGKRKPFHYKRCHNNVKHFHWKELTDNFYKTLDILDDLKSKLIKELDPILYFVKEESPLDKTKQKKKIR